MDGVRGALLAIATLGALAVAGCGEETMSVEEFTGAIEEQGVEIKLGDELFTDDPGKELRSLHLVPLEPATEPISGSLAVYDDTAGAGRGIEACMAAADLLCYRAGNIVVILERGGIEAERLGVAMEKLGE